MSHFDTFATRPSYSILICALALGLIALFAGQAAWFFELFGCVLIMWGIVINWREQQRDRQYCDNLTSGLADLLRDQEAEMEYRLHMDAQVDIMETLPGGRRYYGPMTVDDIYEPLLTNGEEAS